MEDEKRRGKKERDKAQIIVTIPDIPCDYSPDVEWSYLKGGTRKLREGLETRRLISSSSTGRVIGRVRCIPHGRARS